MKSLWRRRGQCTPAKQQSCWEWCPKNRLPIIKPWEESHVRYNSDSKHNTALTLRKIKQESVIREPMKGEKTCHSIRTTYRKNKNKTFVFPVDNRHPPPPQFYFNIMFHILFCFQVTFQEKVIFFLSTISPNSLIQPSIYHKPLPTRSQVSSYWLWFIDEWNSQLCGQGLDRHTQSREWKLSHKEHPGVLSVWGPTTTDTIGDYWHGLRVMAEDPKGQPAEDCRLSQEECLEHFSDATQLSQSQRLCRVQIPCANVWEGIRQWLS